MTTHDRTWLQFMKTERLIKKSQHFGVWNVEVGPRIWDDMDIWTEIETVLERDDVPQAAWLLRRYFEYTAAILADNLQALVKYRSNAKYGFEDLLTPTLNRWCELLKRGIESAKRWDKNEIEARLEMKLGETKKLIHKAATEQWAINPSIHFNEWENFTKNEFKEVIDAYKALLDHIRCSDCGCYPYVMPNTGAAEQLLCGCGTISINLKTK